MNESFKIFGWMTTDLKLSSNELLVYAIIFRDTVEGNGSFDKGSGYIANLLNLSRPYVFTILKKLTERGYIERIAKSEKTSAVTFKAKTYQQITNKETTNE